MKEPVRTSFTAPKLVGLVFGDLCGLVVKLGPSDRIALSVAGMSACFGAVVRAPMR